MTIWQDALQNFHIFNSLNFVDWWILALFMIIIERNFIFSELHIKSICNHIKFRKIFFVIKLWCIFHAMYSSMKNADKMLHFFDHFKL